MKDKPKPTVSAESLSDLRQIVTNMGNQNDRMRSGDPNITKPDRHLPFGASGPAVQGAVQSPPELNLPSRAEQHPAFRHKAQGGTLQEKLDRLPGAPPLEDSKSSLSPSKENAKQTVVAESKETSKPESLVQGRIREWNERSNKQHR